MGPMINALMPGEHNYQQGRPMPGQGQQAPLTQQPAQMMQPQQSEPAKRGGFLGGVGNALGTVLKYGAPEAYEQGRQMKVKGQVGNALAEGNYESAAQTALKAGNIDQGLQLRTAGTEQQAAQRKQEAQGVLQLFTTLQPGQVTQYAMEDPVGFERMTGMSSDEYMQAGAKMQQMGIPPEKFAQMVVSKAQAELGMEAKPTKYGLDLKEVIGPDGKPMLVQASEAGGYKQLEGVSPVPDVDQRPWWAKEDGSIDPAQAANQAAGRSPGVAVYTGDTANGDRPIIGKPEAGFEYAYNADTNSYEARPIKGGSVDTEMGTLESKAFATLEGARIQNSVIKSNIAGARELVSPYTVGYAGLLKDLPMSDQRLLNNKLETVKSILSVEALAEMRANSPTGGALGNVTERELDLLSSLRGRLDQLSKPSDIIEVLDEIDASMDRLMEVREIAYKLQTRGPDGGRQRLSPDTPVENSDLPPGFQVVE